MNYRLRPLAQPTPERIVLERASSFKGWLPTLFRGVGLASLLISLLLLGVLAPSQRIVALDGLGVGFLLLALSQSFVEYRQMPQRFVFDNANQQLLLEGSNDSVVSLSYAEIQGFQTRRLSQKGNGGREVRYVVEMLKRDGAFWVLTSSDQRDKAEELWSQLRHHVKLQRKERPDEPELAQGVGKQIEVFEYPDVTILRWKEQSSLRSGLACLLLSGSLCCLMLPFQSAISLPIWQGALLALGLLVLIGLALLAFSLGRYHTITIDEFSFTYHPCNEGQGDSIRHFMIHNKDIDTILFNFSLNHKEPTLYILKRGETSALIKHKRGQDGIGRSQTITRLLRNIQKIDARELTFAEQLHLENTLQEIIARHSGHHVA